MTGPVVVLGARPGSLGEAIRDAAEEDLSHPVITGGVNGEDFRFDITDAESRYTLAALLPSAVISTVGINHSLIPIHDLDAGEEGHWLDSVVMQMNVNFLHQMAMLQELVFCSRHTLESVVFISSNSAHIARRNSLGYCASKAALSMGVRCAARELEGRPLVWAYEFGLLAGTPMTQATEAVFGPSQSRMIGAENGLNVADAAKQVAHDLVNSWHGLNGATLRFDAGEQ